MSDTITTPIQNALKLPAVSPASTLSDAPPSSEACTVSRTCAELVDVKTLITSGMIAPARVPHVMMLDSFHHIVPSPRSRRRSQETAYVSTTDTADVSHTRNVSGASKFIFAALAYRPPWMASFSRYDRPLATIIMMRMTKIQTMSCTCTVALGTASRMKEMSATPVTP